MNPEGCWSIDSANGVVSNFDTMQKCEKQSMDAYTYIVKEDGQFCKIFWMFGS
jgi:hypothetical protein